MDNLFSFVVALSYVSLLSLSGCNVLGGDFHNPNAKVSAKIATNKNSELDVKTTIDKECIRFFDDNSKAANNMGEQKNNEYIKVGATGYGAPPKNYFPAGQRRLMTMRASKIDAYRALTEIVGGLHVWGSTAIDDMVLAKDRYRTFVDSYVRGARIVSVSAMDDGTYESVVEMLVDRRFLSQVMAFIDPMLAQCLRNNGGLRFADAVDDLQIYNSPSFYYSE